MNIWSVDLNSLRALHALLDTSSVTRAAQRLGITQPASSAALRRLRSMFDDPLLVRSGRGMVRTARGEELLSQTQGFLGAAERILAPTGPLAPSTFSWTVRVGLSEFASTAVLGPIDIALRGRAPGVTLQLVAVGPDPVTDLSRGEMDLLIGPYETRRAQVHSAVLYENEFVCVVRHGHPLSAARLDAIEVTAFDHVVVREGDRSIDPFDGVLTAAGLSRRASRVVTNCWAGAALVAGTDLVLVVPRAVALVVAASLSLRVVDVVDVPAIQVHALWHDRVAGDVRFEWFHRLVHEVVG